MSVQNLIFPVAACAISLSAIAAPKPSGDSLNRNYGIPERVIILHGDSSRINKDVEAVIYDSSDLHFQDPSVPRFLLIDRLGNTALGIGGYVEGLVQYDFNGAIDQSGFTTSAIAVPRNPALRNRLGADATHSTIFLRLVRQTSMGSLSAYVQTQFSGGDSGYGLLVKQAYLRLNKVTAGLTNSTFTDPSAGVPTIDYEGPSGSFGRKNLVFQYRPQFTKNISGAISIENPKASYTTNATCEAIPQRCPDIPAFIQYAWDGGNQHVRLSAIFRDLSYRDLVAGENRFQTGWGVQLTTVMNPVDCITFYGQLGYGKGIGAYVNDLGGDGFDLVPDIDGRMKAPGDLGIVAGLQYNITSKLFISGSYSINRAYNVGSMGGDTYKIANYYVGNMFYTFNSSFQAGIEYVGGTRQNYNGMSDSANRIEAMMKFSF